MFGRNLLGAITVAMLLAMAFSCITAGPTDEVEPVAQTQLPLGASTHMISADKLDIRNLFVQN
jgi:multisubunit Na+/H+ antiporter MnhB subunit